MSSAVWNPVALMRECETATRGHLEDLREMYEVLKPSHIHQREGKLREILGDIVDGLAITADKLENLIDTLQ